MRFLPILVVIAVARIAVPAVAARAEVRRSDPLQVRAVIDGATIDVVGLGRVRLLGVEVMKTSRRFDVELPLGRQARERLQALVLHHWVRLEYEGPARASARGPARPRAAHVVREDGVLVSAVLLREGLARLGPRPPLARFEELQAAEREAQRFRRGVWGLPSPPPLARPVAKPRATRR
jgi:endonuclease YncB( thermonuclease family)